MTTRALSFGSAAAAYERFRPDYPDAIVDTVLDYASTSVGTALEIGAGTGKATRLFAARGIEVTATEPDAAMLDELREHVPASVTTMQAAFESLAPSQTFDLVYAAAALHWTRAEQRWRRIAALLVPSGTFASFGGPTRLADADLESAVRAARAPWLGDDDVPSPDGTPPTSAMQWPGTELESSELFTDVRQITLRRRPPIGARDYVGLLSTVSAYLQLSRPDREQALAATLAVLPDQVPVVADIHAHLARRI